MRKGKRLYTTYKNLSHISKPKIFCNNSGRNIQKATRQEHVYKGQNITNCQGLTRMLYAKKNVHKYKKEFTEEWLHLQCRYAITRSEGRAEAARRLAYTRSQVQFPRLPINKHALSVKKKSNEYIIL